MPGPRLMGSFSIIRRPSSGRTAPGAAAPLPACVLQSRQWCPVRTIWRRAGAQAKIPSLECTSSLVLKSLSAPGRDGNNWNVLRAKVAQALVPNAAYFYHRRSSAFVVGRAILPAAAFQAAFPVRERAFVGQRPAESRLQPGLAAPRIRRDGLQDQKVCGIRHSCLPRRHSCRRLLPRARRRRVETDSTLHAGVRAPRRQLLEPELEPTEELPRRTHYCLSDSQGTRMER